LSNKMYQTEWSCIYFPGIERCLYHSPRDHNFQRCVLPSKEYSGPNKDCKGPKTSLKDIYDRYKLIQNCSREEIVS
jgi:hypothetical protein